MTQWSRAELEDALLYLFEVTDYCFASDPRDLSDWYKCYTDDVVWHEEERCYSILLTRTKWARADVRQLLDQETSRLLGAYLRERPRIAGGVYLFPGPSGPRFFQAEGYYAARWRAFRARAAQSPAQ